MLGEIVFDGESRCWEARVKHALGVVTISFKAERTRDGRAPEEWLHAARTVARALDALMTSSTHQFDAMAEAVREHGQRSAADEISALARAVRLEAIHIHHPGPPPRGVIFFAGDDEEERAWRCDFQGDVASDLGFDT